MLYLLLADGNVILLDNLAWRPQGLDIAADEVQSASAQAACRTLAFELSEQRFPAPRILAFKVGITPHFAPDKFLPLINYQEPL